MRRSSLMATLSIAAAVGAAVLAQALVKAELSEVSG